MSKLYLKKKRKARRLISVFGNLTLSDLRQKIVIFSPLNFVRIPKDLL